MRKSEMSKEQLDERKQLVKALSGAGWKGTDVNKAFDDGMWLNYEASFEYKKKMELTLNYNAKERVVELSVYEPGGKGIDLIIHYEDKLKELLDQLVAFQDDISKSNYKDHVNEIVKLIPETYAALGPEGDKVVRLTEKRLELK